MFILCSYKQTGGKGGCRRLAEILKHLDHDTEMKHKEDIDDPKHGQNKDGSPSKKHQNWVKYWQGKADSAALILICDATVEDGRKKSYANSKACQQEFNYVKNKKYEYLRIGSWMDDSRLNGETIAADIQVWIDENM